MIPVMIAGMITGMVVVDGDGIWIASSEEGRPSSCS